MPWIDALSSLLLFVGSNVRVLIRLADDEAAVLATFHGRLGEVEAIAPMEEAGMGEARMLRIGSDDPPSYVILQERLFQGMHRLGRQGETLAIEMGPVTIAIGRE